MPFSVPATIERAQRRKATIPDLFRKYFVMRARA
jgi:hypothetical protein